MGGVSETALPPGQKERRMKALSKIWGHFFRGRSRAGKPATPRTTGAYPLTSPGSALGVATAYRCVNLLADSVASLPMQCLSLRGGLFEADTACRLHYLLNVQPSPYLSAVDFWQLVVRHVLLRGNAYIFPVYDAGSMGISYLALPDPGAVAHDTLNDTYTVADPVSGVFGCFDEPEVVHVKGFSRDGKHGLSVITHARLALDVASTGDRETLDRFANGGSVRGIVGNESGVRGFGEYQDKQLEGLAADLDGQFRMGTRIAAMPGQVQFTPIALTSADMQFLETRKFSVREVCRFFGVHPSFVFDDTSNNYKSAEMANVAFLTNTLNPLLRKIEAELHRKLVSPQMAGRRKFQFDRRGLYACDLDSRVKYQAQTIAAGIYTVNEWRREENKPPVEGGDRVLVSTSLRGIDETAPAAQDAAGTEEGKGQDEENEKD